MKKLFTIITIITALFSLSAIHAEDKPALDGYCPVCYISAGKAVEGKPEHSASYKGKTYHFVSDDVKKTFIKEPTKWLPQYDGYCAYGIAKGKKVESDPKIFTVYEGKLYLNKSKNIGNRFDKKPQVYIKDADARWARRKK